jgi:hypothetical protein
MKTEMIYENDGWKINNIETPNMTEYLTGVGFQHIEKIFQLIDLGEEMGFISDVFYQEGSFENVSFIYEINEEKIDPTNTEIQGHPEVLIEQGFKHYREIIQLGLLAEEMGFELDGVDRDDENEYVSFWIKRE